MAKAWNKREAKVCFILGLTLSDLYKNECAIELFQDALRYDPSFVSAYVAMGVAYGQMEAYDEMLVSFREAVHRDHLSTRIAAAKEPKEIELIRQILYPPELAAPKSPLAPRMPPEIVQARDMIVQALAYLAEGRDEESVKMLEQSLRIDSISQYAVLRLPLAYLLLWRRNREIATEEESVLWESNPELAMLLFR
jgi:tetratricopeptide (TPR) repeat protein